MNYDKLNGRQRDVAEYLPANYTEIAEHFGIGESTARDHVRGIKNKVGLDKRVIDGKAKFYPKGEAPAPPEHPTNKNKNNRSSIYGKQAITKKANKELHRLNKRLTRLLNNTKPAVADGGHPINPGHEDVVIHVTDDHHGDVVSDEFGNEIFGPEISLKRAEHRVTNTLEKVERQRRAGYEFDTVNYLMGGDIVTGAGIYEGQAHEVVLSLNEQIDQSTTIHLDQIRRLSEEFDAVQVVCQTGNHGEIRVSGSSKEANADDIVYRMLDLAVRESEMENVTFIRNDHTGFTNFRMRNDPEKDQKTADALGLNSVDELAEENRSGWTGHLRHGDNALEHIGTSSSKRKWRGWKLDHEFDIAYRGHYHQPSRDMVREAPVIMSGSIKPASDFEESISEWSVPAATIHGVSDSEVMTWSHDVQFTM